MKPVNQLTHQFAESVIRGMTRVCAAAGGINLAQGFPDWNAPREIKDAVCQAIQGGHNQYAITWGQESLRLAIAARIEAYNKFSVDPRAR